MTVVDIPNEIVTRHSNYFDSSGNVPVNSGQKDLSNQDGLAPSYRFAGMYEYFKGGLTARIALNGRLCGRQDSSQRIKNVDS